MTRFAAIVFAVVMASALALACGKKDDDKAKNATGPSKSAAIDAAAQTGPSKIKHDLRKLVAAASACIKDEECIGPLHPCKPGCGVTYNPDKNPELSKILSAANTGVVCKQACPRDVKTACVKNKCVVVKQ